MSTLVSLGISLEVGHCGDAEGTATALLSQLRTGNYDEMSVLPVPLDIGEWRSEHGTARRRAHRASLHYAARPLKRENYADDIHAINTSASTRQGRPMSAGYLQRQEYSPLPDFPCARHAIRVTGVFHTRYALESHPCVAYLVMIRAGELALVSQILGHADHLENEIMYLLFEHALEREIVADPACLVVYNRHDSGTEGLRFFKERLGFQPMPVEWLP